MNRRQFLTVAVGGGTLLGGCLTAPTSSGGRTKSPTPGGIVDYEFEWSLAEPPWEYDDSVSTEIPSAADPPQLLIIGHIPTGSRSCMETGLKDIEYDRETLTVKVHDDHLPDKKCTMEQGLIRYELLVTFENALPETLEIIHIKEKTGGGKQIFRKTITVQ